MLYWPKSLVHTKSELEEYKVYVGNPLKHFKDRDKEAVLRYVQRPEFYKKIIMKNYFKDKNH